MVEMHDQIPSKAPVKTPGEEIYDGLSKGASVWGAAFGLAWLVDHGLKAVTIPYAWRLSISGILLFLSAFAFFTVSEKRPNLRDSFYAWRHVIVLIIAGIIGYSWHASEYANSNEALFNEAARWACARHSPCTQSMEQYLFDRPIK